MALVDCLLKEGTLQMKTGLIALGLLLIGVCSVCSALPPTPEIDPASGVSAIALLAGAVLVIRARRR
jgi:hypothetical protein